MEECIHRRMCRILSLLSATHYNKYITIYLESQQLMTLRMHVKCHLRAVFYFVQYCDYVSVKYLTVNRNYIKYN